MNRAQRRQFKHGKGIFKKAKPHVENWTCPNCDQFYDLLFVQSKAEPYLFCKDGCDEFFDLNGTNVTDVVYPNGKPF